MVPPVDAEDFVQIAQGITPLRGDNVPRNRNYQSVRDSCACPHSCTTTTFILLGSTCRWTEELSSSWDGRPFGHNKHGPKIGACAPLGGEPGRP